MTEIPQPSSQPEAASGGEGTPPELDGLDLLMKYLALKEDSRKAFAEYRHISAPFGEDQDDWGMFDADMQRSGREISDDAETRLRDFENSFPDIVEAYRLVRSHGSGSVVSAHPGVYSGANTDKRSNGAGKANQESSYRYSDSV